ncbi:MAG: prepilin-type N-terminal cleavage/methylation domain-containing protein [Candidatus Paceibacterota bacterium]|jgi:prepilin-type N-terminal cleavage/methylation domain-containing protein
MINLKNKGFSLLETLIAVTIVVIGALGVFSAVAKYSTLTQNEKDSLVAAYLCQEGIEITKNIRDTNWIEGAGSWKDGLTGCSSGCEIDFNDSALSAFSADDYLYIDNSTGLYEYKTSPGSEDIETFYTREITITEVGDDELDIQVSVVWPGHNMIVKQNIYNWR